MEFKLIFDGNATLEDLCILNEYKGYEFLINDGKIVGIEES